jgi:hypothetical protein
MAGNKCSYYLSHRQIFRNSLSLAHTARFLIIWLIHFVQYLQPLIAILYHETRAEISLRSSGMFSENHEDKHYLFTLSSKYASFY